MSELAAELTGLVRSLAGQTGDPWHQVRELGLAGIGIGEESGGSGGELADLLLVIGELSRAGLSTPIVEASTAAFAVGPAAAEGFDTVVVTGDGVPEDLGVVPFAPSADRLVIIGSRAVSALKLSDAHIDPVTDIAGQPAGRVRVAGASLTEYAVCADQVVDRLALARSAALLGSARGAYELTRGYVIERRQFGAPLIDIPSVAGSLALMAIRIGAAQAALDRAVSATGFASVAAARIATAQTATVVAGTSHQLHGAMGITSEYPLHRFTTALWAMRDADVPERDWCGRLGDAAIAVDEDALWNELTA